MLITIISLMNIHYDHGIMHMLTIVALRALTVLLAS